MVPRVLSSLSLALVGLVLGCGPAFEPYFEPLSSAGDASAAGNANAGASVGGSAGAGGSAEASAGTNDYAPDRMPSAGTTSANAGSGGSGGSGGAGGGQAGATASSAGAPSGGQAGAANDDCSTVPPWLGRDYAIGERVTSLCQAPYNAACPAQQVHEFECQPATGLVGRGWCTTRQPGVGNGWQEAWLLKAACPG